jgi:hypothetical protein
MAIFYVSIYHRVKDISYDVDLIDDVKFKKTPKGTYQYN